MVAPELRVPLQRVDLRALAPVERETAQLSIRRERAHTAFDLAAGPLIVTDLLQLEDQRWLFLLHMHHIVSDGWSMGVFSRELSALYDAFLAGLPAPLPPLALQYGDFAAWQRETFSGDALKGQLDYWRAQLKGLAPLDLPTDRARPPMQSHRGAFHSVHLGTALNSRCIISARLGLTPFMTLLAAFGASRAHVSDDVRSAPASPAATAGSPSR